MSYTPNCPVSGQTLGNSRPIINSNFMTIQSVYDENHVDFNDANAGAHTHVDLLAQTMNPNPLATLVSHYSKALSGVTEWYFQREQTAGPTDGMVIQMSSGNPVVGASFPSSGQTFLPGGLQLKWGSGSVAAGASITIVFTTQGLTKFPTRGLIGFVSAFSTGSQFSVGSLTDTQIVIGSPGPPNFGGGSFMWFAIGN